jgi:hypothetical protein
VGYVADRSAEWDDDPMALSSAMRDHRVMVEKPSATPRADLRPAAPPADDRPTAPPRVAVTSYDRVDESGDASFPASDPPSWWSGR